MVQRNSDPLDLILEKFNLGDTTAAERVFRSFEPYLRVVVRRTLPAHLRVRFDSLDVVQSVWADLWQGLRAGQWHFTCTGQLKAFLIKATRNRLIDGVRKHGAEVQRQRPIETAGGQRSAGVARPEDVVEAEELWRRMLDLCPGQHHDLLRLRRQGHSFEEIARQTGLHESSVRRILYELARQLMVRH
jgi:RNA polymerase sigma-70 factor (ECF subfamily)